METNKDVIIIGLHIFVGALLAQFFLSFVSTGSFWEWFEISHNVIPFGSFFLVVLYIVKECDTRKMNENNS